MRSRYKFFSLVVILLFCGFIITSYLSYSFATKLARNSLTNNSLPLSSDNVYSEIQRDLLKPNLVSSLMANDTFLINWILNGEGNIAEITNYLKKIKNQYNTSSSFLVSNKSKNYYFSEGILKKIDPTKKEDIWFYRVESLVDEYESNIDHDLANDNTLTIFTNYKIKDNYNNFIGVTGVGLKTSNVTKLLDTYKRKYNHEIYFVNRKNNLILNSKTLDKSKSQKFKNIISQKVNEFNKENKNTLEYVYKNETYHLNIRYIDELNLYLCIEAKEKDFTQDIKNNFLLNISIFTIVILLIMTLVIYYINTYQKSLEFFARKDRLTKISNRHEFEDRFKELYKDALNNKNTISIILFDIDNFKEVNDTFGHAIGDKILILVANIFKEVFKPSDLVARWGGEEFISVITNINKESSFLLAEKLRLRIYEDKKIHKLINKPLSVSIGIAKNKEKDKEGELFLRVDKNLFKAKHNGKNQTVG